MTVKISALMKLRPNNLAIVPLLLLSRTVFCIRFSFETMEETLGTDLSDLLLMVAVHIDSTRLIDNII